MNHSFKFIVNPNNTKQVEITTLLQYCALKNTFSEFIPNNIKSMNFSGNQVYFSNKNKNFNPDISFTKYIQMEQSERDIFKTKYLNDINAFSLFFDALSESENLNYFKERRHLRFENKDTTSPDNYIIDDLYTVFMYHEYANRYLSKYIPKNSKEVCYVDMNKDSRGNTDILYDDNFIKFNIIGTKHNDEEIEELVNEYSSLVNCINDIIAIQISNNDGLVENTYDEFCIYTEDPNIIQKVLMNNQRIIDTTRRYIDNMKYRPCGKYSHTLDIFIELQTLITNIVNSCESSKKKAENRLAMLNNLFK